MCRAWAEDFALALWGREHVWSPGELKSARPAAPPPLARPPSCPPPPPRQQAIECHRVTGPRGSSYGAGQAASPAAMAVKL